MANDSFNLIITRISIAGIIGALLLSASTYIIISDFNSRFQPEEYDFGPGPLVHGALMILAFILSALITGFVSNFLVGDRTINVKPQEKKIIGFIRNIGLRIFYSFTAGLITFVFIWFELIILRINELGIRNLSMVFTDLIKGMFSVGILYFIMVAVIFAFFSILGGICYGFIRYFYGLISKALGEKGLKI